MLSNVVTVEILASTIVTIGLPNVVVKFGAMLDVKICGVMVSDAPPVMTDSVLVAPTAR